MAKKKKTTDPYAEQNVSGLKKVVIAEYDGPVEASPEVKKASMHMPVGPRRLSDETLAGMKALETAIRDQQTKDQKAVERAKEVLEEEGETKVGLEVDEEIARQFSTVFYRNTPIDNPRTRKAIEARCSEINFEDLILSGRVAQLVPIIKDKLEVVFQSLQTRDLIWIDEEREKRHGTESVEGATWAGYAKLALSLVALNDVEFVNCFGKDDSIDNDKFDLKYDQLIGKNDKMTEALFVNYGWFDDRVLRMFSPDEEFEQLKNG